MVENIIEAKLVAVKEAEYTIYVFKDILNNKFIMCTRLPNWQIPEIEVGDEGFLQYQVVKAGDVYFDILTDSSKKYKYTNIYFTNFVKKSNEINKEEIIL